ncbi:hypothetical protein J1N35_038706 [Gossypium stocksii]|uniref:Uncharacterized protein n=1 Tax=Gossypium stocksii TaxID=47602 RepID=A0A9D3UMD4_9ROSI|nr:hypothetical protein J1N35_038706 [Gossypium stocksii]
MASVPTVETILQDIDELATLLLHALTSNGDDLEAVVVEVGHLDSVSLKKSIEKLAENISALFPDRSKRKILWEGLKATSPSQPIPSLIVLDFNAILSPEDKRSPYSVGKRCNPFGNFVETCDLQDLGYYEPSFTWQ